MPRPTPATEKQRETARSRIAESNLDRAAVSFGVSPSTLARVAAGQPVSKSTLARIVDRTRKAAEFTGAVSVQAQRRQQSAVSWSLPLIRAARDAQMRGDFAQPVRLAEAMRTDDALFTAYHNRIAPQSAIATKLVPCDGARGVACAKRAANSVFVTRSTIEGLHGTMANHGIAIGYNEHEPNDDGTRVDFRLTEWPLEHVRHNPSTEVLETYTRENGLRIPIVHGDGRWVVFRKFNVLPWTQEACVLPGALLWAAHANGVKDWAQASSSHGQAKIVGELPEGVPLHDDAGLTPETRMFLQMLQDLVSGEAGAGIRPAGAKTDFLANGSTAWQVFKELIENREKAAARIYLGTDAMMGSVGGAPGVDISLLFGVASTKLQGDLTAIEQALRTGVYEPWAAINDGDSRYAPSLVYQLPDPDSEKKSAERAAKRDRLFGSLDRMKALGMVIDQAAVNMLAAEYGVDTPPQLGNGGSQDGAADAGADGRGEGGARA